MLASLFVTFVRLFGSFAKLRLFGGKKKTLSRRNVIFEPFSPAESVFFAGRVSLLIFFSSYETFFACEALAMPFFFRESVFLCAIILLIVCGDYLGGSRISWVGLPLYLFDHTWYR